MTTARGVSANDLAVYDAFYSLDHFVGRRAVNAVLGKPRRRLREAFLGRLRTQRGETLPVDRRADLPLQTFVDEYLMAGRPVVLAGAAARWRCVESWTLEHLTSVCASDPVTLLPRARTTNGFQGTRESEAVERTTFDAFARGLVNGSGKYLRFSTMLEDHPALAADVDLEWFRAHMGPRPLGRRLYAFIGGEGTRTRLHCDYPPNLFVQVSGRKHWVLFDPAYRAAIDPLLERSSLSFTTNLEVREPMAAPDCISRHCDRYETILEPGDVLFNPAYMWHDVVNLTDTIAVSVRWLTPAIIRRAAWVPQLLNLFATNPPLWRAGLTKRDINADLLDSKNQAKRDPAYRG
jgi:hypothetical protein